MSNTPVSLFIAVPMFGGQCFASFTYGCLELQKLCVLNDIPVQFSFLLNESLIHRGRNDLAAKFLESNHSHLIYIDADIGFQAQDIGKMVAANKDVIGGTYPRKKINWQNVRAALKAEPAIDDFHLEHCAADFIFKTLPGKEQFMSNELVPMTHIPTGFMCIKRTVVEALSKLPGAAYLEHNIPNSKPAEQRYRIFDTGVNEHGEFLSEDFWFCREAIKQGFEIWMDPSIVLTHTGSYVFKGHLPYIASLMAKAPPDADGK